MKTTADDTAGGSRPQAGDKLVFTVEEAATLLGLGRSGAYDAARRGDIPTLKVGRRLLVPKMQLLAMLGMVATDNHHDTSDVA